MHVATPSLQMPVLRSFRKPVQQATFSPAVLQLQPGRFLSLGHSFVPVSSGFGGASPGPHHPMNGSSPGSSGSPGFVPVKPPPSSPLNDGGLSLPSPNSLSGLLPHAMTKTLTAAHAPSATK